MFTSIRLSRKSSPDKRSFLGFTLVELLVVVVIIAVLAAIAVPVFLNQKKKAEEAAAQANVSALADLLAVAQSTGGTVTVTEGEVVGTDGSGATTRLVIPAEMNVRVQVGTAKGTAVTDAGFTAGTWCVSLTNPAGGVISMQNGETKPNMAGNACYAGPSLNTSPANGGSGTVSTPPTSVVATAGDADASITWVAPSSDGGNAIANYVVTAAPGGATCTSVMLGCTVAGLTNNTSYTFTVKANNSMGASAASDPSNSVTPLLTLTIPGAPTAVTGDSGDRNVLVSWTAPSDTGNTTITGYTVTRSPAGTGCTTNGALSCTISGLTNGTVYTFSVTATNSVGTGAAGVSPEATPSAAPGAPENVTGVAGNTQATVSWDVPLDDGATPITTYTVTSSPSSVGCTRTGSPPTRSCIVTGLTNGSSYTFSVTATNSRGTGPAGTSTAVALPTVPAAPTGVTGIRSVGQIVVSWVAPANGGSAITGYTATSNTGGFTCTVTGLTCTITGVSNATAYTFTVKATNSVGEGPASSPSASIAGYTVPNAPTGVAGTVGIQQSVVTWTASSDNGGLPITGYTVTSSPGGLTCSTSGALTCTVTGLTGGTAYTFTVTATSLIGTGAASAASSAVTPILPYNTATGGEINTYTESGKRYQSHTFLTNGNFIVGSASRTFDVLLVGGGGRGSARWDTGAGWGPGGAGGGGEVLLVTSKTIPANTYAVVVGGSVQNSTLYNMTGRAGLNAGGNGGASGNGNGGGGYVTNNGGGGGGAGVAASGANGGNGLTSTLRTGASVWYGGGGGGGGRSGATIQGNTGLGGGGAGSNYLPGSDGSANTGGGGGGAGTMGTGTSGGAGGTGIVIIRYEIAP